VFVPKLKENSGYGKEEQKEVMFSNSSEDIRNGSGFLLF